MTTTNREIAQVMDVMPYGFYIVGSTGEAGPNGMMADWVSQVSFNPRLISVAIENDANTLANIRANPRFTLNFLSEGKAAMDLARRFSGPFLASKIGGPQAQGVHRKLFSEDYRLGSLGCPILKTAMAWLECEVFQLVSTGDHTLVIGQVVDGHLEYDAAPLSSAYTGWTYSG